MRLHLLNSSSLIFSSSTDFIQAFLEVLLVHIEQAVHAPLPVLAFTLLSCFRPHQCALIRARYCAICLSYGLFALGATCLQVVSGELRW